MKTINFFFFELDQRVATPFKDYGIITMLVWLKESQLSLA